MGIKGWGMFQDAWGGGFGGWLVVEGGLLVARPTCQACLAALRLIATPPLGIIALLLAFLPALPCS